MNPNKWCSIVIANIDAFAYGDSMSFFQLYTFVFKIGLLVALETGVDTTCPMPDPIDTVTIQRLGETALQVEWNDSHADVYEVWQNQTVVDALSSEDCAAASNCFTTSDTFYTFHSAVGDMDNAVYQIVARNVCGATMDASSLVGKFDFQLGSDIDWSDSDNDRLPDVWETNTKVFLHAHDTGTDPQVADTDGDGILDGDEVLGTKDGLDLFGMGANPLVKNIFLEYDWFDDDAEPAVCAAHSHRPTQTAVSQLAQTFANADVPNPDGSTGIVLIQDYGQGGLFVGGNHIDHPTGIIEGGIGYPEMVGLKEAHFAQKRLGYFHYVLMPHRYDGGSSSSGQADLPGDDMIVALYCYSTDHKVIAHAVMHELGHNLKLLHGGNNWVTAKANYNSIMNTRYEFSGVDNNCTPEGDGVLDYSYGTHVTIHESDLDERVGICGEPFAWDWNGNGIIEPSVAVDLNGDNSASRMTDYNDWMNLDYAGVYFIPPNSIKKLPVTIVSEEPLPPINSLDK